MRGSDKSASSLGCDRGFVQGAAGGPGLRGDLHRPIEVVVVGGCHVTGWKVGEACAFPLDLQAWLERDTGRSVCLRLDGAAKVTTAAHSPALIVEDRPIDLLILQLANLETSTGLRSVIAAKKEGRPQPVRSIAAVDPTQAQVAVDPDRRAAVGKGLVKSLVNLAAAKVLAARGYVIFDRERFRQELDECFQAIAALRPGKVIVLSSFPSYHLRLNAYRQHANAIMRDMAGRFGWSYLDVFDVVSPLFGLATFTGGAPLMSDAYHLNRQGHVRLAEAIARAI